MTTTNRTTIATSSAIKSNGVCVTSQNQLRPLHCAEQQYEWGRLGSSSTVALMKDAQCNQEGQDTFFIDEDKPYAELWLGTHPSGMSMVSVHNKSKDSSGKESTTKCSLLQYIQDNPGLHCGDNFSTDITFLLKVLSVRKVLSIQAHPDKALAEKLHKERPHIYKDPNHKPEMAIAMSHQARAMCGFRPLAEIAQHLDEYPEFKSLVGTHTAEQIKRIDLSPQEQRSTLQSMFKAYLDAPADVINHYVDTMVTRLQRMEHHNPLQKLILQLEQQFPGDCGIFAPLIFNIVELHFGQALFIGANEPHAYISGEILECMACSDNVVRAGLTPKLKDVPTLLEMLTYNTSMPAIQSGTYIDQSTTRYLPPVRDFCVEIVHVKPGLHYDLAPVPSPSVLLILEGDAVLQQDNVYNMHVSFGSAAFCSANTPCTIVAGPYGVRLTRAMNNVFFE